jgi:hypothetical protein
MENVERNDLYGGPIGLNIFSPIGRKGNGGWNSSLYLAIWVGAASESLSKLVVVGWHQLWWRSYLLQGEVLAMVEVVRCYSSDGSYGNKGYN